MVTGNIKRALRWYTWKMQVQMWVYKCDVQSVKRQGLPPCNVEQAYGL